MYKFKFLIYHRNLGVPAVKEKHGETEGDEDQASTPEGRKSEVHQLASKRVKGSNTRAGSQATNETKPRGTEVKPRETPRTSTLGTGGHNVASPALPTATAPSEVADKK